MSTPRELALAYYEAVDSGDTHRVLSMFRPDAVYRRGGYAPIEGAAELRDFYDNVRIIDSGEHTVHSVICEGSRAAVRGRFDGVSRGGEQLAVEWADFFDYDGDLIRERTTYFFTAGV